MKTIRRPIFLLIAFLCAVNLFAQNTAPVATTNAVVQNAATNPVPLGAGWVARHEGFVAQAKQGGIDILFMGDSITDFWRNRGSNVWNQYYAPRHAANFGISGDRTQHVLWRMDNGELDGIKPKVVVLMIGTNNTGKERDKKSATPFPKPLPACRRWLPTSAPGCRTAKFCCSPFSRAARRDEQQAPDQRNQSGHSEA